MDLPPLGSSVIVGADDPHQGHPDEPASGVREANVRDSGFAGRGPSRRHTHLTRRSKGWSRAIVWSLLGLSGFAVVFGSVARLDSSITAHGRLQPAGGVVEVLPPFAAPIRRVWVKEGQRVQRGQLLVELEGEDALRQRQELRALADLWWKEGNRAALQLGQPAVPPLNPEQGGILADQQRDLALRRVAAEERLERSRVSFRQRTAELETLLRKQVINRRIQGRLERLAGQGAISRLELDRQQERSVELDGLIHTAEQQRQAAWRELAETSANRDQSGTSSRRQLHSQAEEARRQLLEIRTRLEQLDSRLRLSRLTAPVTGQVFDLKARPGEQAAGGLLLRIVPEGPLEARLAISNRDIGLLKPGMPVELRVVSFPFSDYGSLRGRLSRIGADALPQESQPAQEAYPATVQLELSHLERGGQRFPLRSGMAVTGLIQLGSRPLLALMNDRIGEFLDSLRTLR